MYKYFFWTLCIYVLYIYIIYLPSIYICRVLLLLIISLNNVILEFWRVVQISVFDVFISKLRSLEVGKFQFAFQSIFQLHLQSSTTFPSHLPRRIVFLWFLIKILGVWRGTTLRSSTTIFYFYKCRKVRSVPITLHCSSLNHRFHPSLGPPDR